jgi:hypothetical protein
MASLSELSSDGSSKQRERLIAVYIAILAVALSICSVGGGNATKDATARWAFFQAKNIRGLISMLNDFMLLYSLPFIG